MAEHILGPLYYERTGRYGPPMIFIHPNPMDVSAWMFQLAHFSTWYRCVAIDIPGYGRSPGSAPGLTLADIATGCWEVVDELFTGERVILVGCSAGSAISMQMYHLHPAQVAALVLSGTGYSPDGDAEWEQRRNTHIDNYRAQGASYRWQFTFDDFSPAFRATPMARYVADILRERNDMADVQSIIEQFEALKRPRGRSFYADIGCPVLIVSGTEDAVHDRAVQLRDVVPDATLRIVPGAGHACQVEQPWTYDWLVLEFLSARGLLPQG